MELRRALRAFGFIFYFYPECSSCEAVLVMGSLLSGTIKTVPSRNDPFDTL